MAGSDSPFGLRRDISRVFGKIEQACSISKEVYVCCSKIVDSVFIAKGRCAQSVSIKKTGIYLFVFSDAKPIGLSLNAI